MNLRSVRRICRVAFCCLLAYAPAQHAAETPATRQLLDRNSEFEQAIIRVSDNVYTAVGYGVSTVSMIVGRDGLVIVDAGIDVPSSRAVREDFRAISDKPVKAVVLTHGHPDHLGGLAAFADDPAVQIWVREGFESEANFLRSGGVTRQRLRGAMQAGFMLSPEERINNGIARPYWPKRGGAVFESGHAAAPTHFVTRDRHRLSVAGIDIDLVAVDGETNDHLYIWFPKERVVFTGDNFYKSWPNLYPIRGAAYRDVRKWVLAVDAMLQEGPKAVVGGHTRPVIGAEQSVETLTNYRDAIQYLFEATIDGINRGLTPNQLVEAVKLPERFRTLDYLQPYYGNPEWAIRAIFTGYLGWFDGNATNLFPLSDAEEARRVAAMAGGVSGLQRQADESMRSGDYQWVLQLCDYVLALDPQNSEARLRKADALTALAADVLTATARNYYLSAARQLRAPTKQDAPEPVAH